MNIIKETELKIIQARNKKDMSGYAQLKKFHTSLSAFDRYRFRLIADILSNKQLGIVADIGCGIGETADCYSSFASRVFLFDRDDFLLKAGDPALGADKGHIYYTCGNVADLPFKDESFDTVIILEVIEHLAQNIHERIIGELLRIAKEGASIYISTPNRFSLAAAEGRFIELLNKGYKWNAWDTSHKYIYSSFELVAFLKNFRANIKSVRGFYYLPGSLLVRMPFVISNFLGFLSYLISKYLGRIFPFKYIGFTTIIELKKI